MLPVPVGDGGADVWIKSVTMTKGSSNSSRIICLYSLPFSIPEDLFFGRLLTSDNLVRFEITEIIVGRREVLSR